MDREYLLKVIEKNFFVLSKDEISEQVDKSNLKETLKVLLKNQDDRLNEAENIGVNHAIFYDAISTAETHILAEKGTTIFVLKFEKLFDEALLLVSIYYHYSAIQLPNTMAAFIRLILKEKILLA